MFVGNNRIDRTDMNDDEESVMQLFDRLCFRNLRRGHNFPVELLYELSKKLDLTKFIVEMFKKRMPVKQENKNKNEK